MNLPAGDPGNSIDISPRPYSMAAIFTGFFLYFIGYNWLLALIGACFWPATLLVGLLELMVA